MRLPLSFVRTASRPLLWLERSAPAWLPVSGLWLGFAALSLMGLWPQVWPWLHAALLFSAFALSVWQLWRRRGALRLPSQAEADRWLETKNQLPHQPLLALEDVSALPSDPSLWALHRARARAILSRLRPARPRLALAARDRYSLRAPLAFALLLGLLLAGDKAGERLRQGFFPELTSPYLGDGVIVEARLAPPAYTGAKTRLLTPGDKTPVSAPAGSVLDVRVRRSFWTPRLQANGASIAPKAQADGSVSFRATLTRGGAIRVSSGLKTAASWKLDLIADAPPRLGVAALPQRTPTGSLKIQLQAEDDYGVTAARAVIAFDTEAGMSVRETEPLILDLPAHGRRRIDEASYHEAGFHMLSGLPVTMHLEAEDAAGQVTRGPAVKFILPEAEFRHPVARAIIAERKALEAASAPRMEIAEKLRRLMARPGAYGGDLKTFLALDVASFRLAYKGEADSVRLLLWRTAVHVEQSGMADKRDAVRQALQRLKQALASGKQGEIQRAWQETMRQMQEMMQARMRQSPPEARLVQQLQAATLAQAMQQVLDTASTGNRGQAQAMVNRIEQALEEAPSMTIPPALLQQLMEAAASLAKLQQDQTGLHRRTEDAKQAMENLRNAQQALQSQAGKVAQALGQCQASGLPLPGTQALEDAQGAMEHAAQALKTGNRAEALARQAEALRHIEKQMEALKQSMQGQGGGGMPTGLGFGLESFTGDAPGGGLFGDLPVPNEGALQRSRQIQQELQRRAGERSRSTRELDYIERLLEMY